MSSRAPSGLFLGLFQFVSVLAAGAQGAAPPVIPVDRHGDRLPPGALVRFGTVRLRHTGLAALAFSPEGNRLFSLGATNLGAELRLWDLAGGKLLGQRPLPMTGMALPPLIASDGSIYLVEGGSVQRFKDLQSGTNKIYYEDSFNPTCAAVSRDPKLLAVARGEGEILLLELPQGKEKLRLGPPGAAEGATRPSISPSAATASCWPRRPRGARSPSGT